MVSNYRVLKFIRYILEQQNCWISFNSSGQVDNLALIEKEGQ